MKTAFTLIELLVVIAAIGILAALLLPAPAQARTLDDFDDGLKRGWSDWTFDLGGAAEGGGAMAIQLDAGRVRQPVFVATARNTERLAVAQGETVEMAVDLISTGDEGTFAVLAWVPDTQPLSAFAGYFLAVNGREVRVGKAIHKYFRRDQPQPPLPNRNVKLVLTLGSAGGTTTVRARLLDNDAGGAVLFDQTINDTPAADVLADGTDDPPAPFAGPGQFVLMGYAEFQSGDPDQQHVLFDNAEVSTAAPDNERPVLHDIQPPHAASFLLPDARFELFGTDETPWNLMTDFVGFTSGPFAAQSISIVPGTGGLTLRANPAAVLVPNRDEAARLLALDSEGGSNVVFLRFDTFCRTCPVLEVEDYNFGGGQFIEVPAVVPENSPPTDNAYPGQVGVAGVDFQDSTPDAANGPYRPQDPIGTLRSLDYVRWRFTDVGGAQANVFDYDVQGIQDGEWLRYTRSFPDGDYDVFLREAVLNLDQAETALDRILPSPEGGETATELGRFVAQRSGFEYRNVPLTDTDGTPVKVRLSGRETLRLRQLTSAPPDGAIRQNYLVFAVPTQGCLAVESAPDPIGPYSPDPGALVAGDMVLLRPTGDAARFYRLVSDVATRLIHGRWTESGIVFQVLRP